MSSLQPKIKANFIICELSVKRAVSFGIVHFAELQIDSSIKYKNDCLEIIFTNLKVKRILIAFSCFQSIYSI